MDFYFDSYGDLGLQRAMVSFKLERLRRRRDRRRSGESARS